MSSSDYIEVHVAEGTSFKDLVALGATMEALNDFDPTTGAGPNYQGFVKFTGKHLGMYEADDGLDQYGTRVRIYNGAEEFARAIANELATGEVTVLDLPEGNPASVFVVTPGKVTTLVDGQRANWNM